MVIYYYKGLPYGQIAYQMGRRVTGNWMVKYEARLNNGHHDDDEHEFSG